MKDKELKPCGHCGSIRIDYRYPAAKFARHCRDCGSQGHVCGSKTAADDAWNTRPSPWIEVGDMPECFMSPYPASEKEWKAKYLTVEHCADKTTIHSAEEIWLSEDSEVELYMSIPEPPKKGT